MTAAPGDATPDHPRRLPARPRGGSHELARPKPALVPTLATLVLALALTGASPGAEEGAEVEAEPDAPVAAEHATLVVETSLPFAPTSNTIATKLPRDLARTPAHVGVVEASHLREQGARILGDALESVSGLNVQTGNGVFDVFVIRGFESTTSGLVLTDGAPEPEATFYQLYNTERVEVFKGPAGFLYGSNPLAGAINLVREQPMPTAFARAGLSVGSFSTYEAQVDVNRSLSAEVDFRFNGLYRESAGHRDGRDSEVLGINPALTWRPGPATSVNLNLEVAASDFVPDAGLPLVQGRLPDLPRSRSYGSPFDLSEQEIQRFQVDVEHQVSDRVTLRDKAFYRELDWRTRGTLLAGVFPNPFQPDRRLVARNLVDLDDRQGLLGNQLEAVLSWQSGAIEHQLLVGLEVLRYTDEFTLDVSFLPVLDLFAPVETATEPLVPVPGQAVRGDAESRVVAPYLIDQMALSPRWQLLVGARWDDIEYDDPGRGDARDDSEVSPMVGLVYTPRPELAFYVNGARSFAPPSPRVTGERRPEGSEQLEVGVRHDLADGRGRWSLAAYELRRDNIAIPDDNGFTQQSGDQRARGVELELFARLPAAVEARFSYAYTDSELTRFRELVFTGAVPPFLVFDRSGNRSALSPEHLADLWLSRRFGAWMAGLGARYVDEQFLAEDNLAAVDAHTRVDAALSYQLPHWTLSLHLNNLTDTDYETRGFGSSSVIPGAPASARLGVEVRF